MWKKTAALLGIIVLAVLANTNVACRVTVANQTVDGLYSSAAVDRALTAAGAAAEEIVRGKAELPEVERRYVLTFTAPEKDIRSLTDCILRSSYGVEALSGVYVNGMMIGTVENGEILLEKMYSYLHDNMPGCAVRAGFSEELDVRTVYSRRGSAYDYDDMILLISGLAPVIYTTEDGNVYHM